MIIQERLLKIIRDDSYAAGFQSLGQYRTALLQAARGEVGPAAVQGEPVFMWHRGATDDESEVVDVDCACPCCVPLYAAPQPAEQHPFEWPELERPAKVGAGRFDAGVSSRLVVEAAQRQYEYDVTPEKEADRIARLDGFRKAILQPAPDVAGLVEALRRIADLPIDPCSTENDYRLSAAKAIAAGVLADHRSRGGDQCTTNV